MVTNKSLVLGHISNSRCTYFRSKIDGLISSDNRKIYTDPAVVRFAQTKMGNINGVRILRVGLLPKDTDLCARQREIPAKIPGRCLSN